MKYFRWFSNLKIKQKLLLSFFAIPIIFVIIVGFVSYLSSTNALRRQSYELINQYQQSTIADINRNKNRYELIAQTITDNTTIQTLISPYQLQTTRELEIVRTVLNPMFFSFMNAAEAGINIQLIRYNDYNSEIIMGNVENILAYPRAIPFYINDGSRQYQVINLSRAVNMPWFESLIYDDGGQLNGNWLQIGNDSEYGYITFLSEISNMAITGANATGLLRLTIMFDTIYSESPYTAESGFNLVFNNQNRLLSAEPHKIHFFEDNSEIINSFINNSNSEMLLGNQGITLIKSEAFSDGWYIISAYPTGIITENVNRIAIITIMTFMIAGALLLLLTFILSNSFSKRLNVIATQMQQFSSQEPSVRVTEMGQDEIGFLSDTFNEMSEQITTLIYDNYISDIEKKDALLKALQAQINPHILYNSLSAISRLADLGRTEEITNMVQALTTFYRMTLNQGNEILSVGDELAQIKAYIEVFRIRKGETFDVVYDIDENLLQYQSIKVILQPFVENIYEHATKPDGSLINIYIGVAAKGSDILFTVKDDGIGITNDKIDDLLYEDTSQGYGIVNVHTRIKHQYGPDYGVTITSKPEQGTCIKILIPQLEMP